MKRLKLFKGMSPDEKKAILTESLATGEPVEKVAARLFPILPPVAILNEDLTFLHEGKMITVKEWHEEYDIYDGYGLPLVVIGDRATIEKYNKTNLKNE